MNGKVALEEHWAVNETLHIPGQPVAAGAFWDETRCIRLLPLERSAPGCSLAKSIIG
jgi:hypothetical protein